MKSCSAPIAVRFCLPIFIGAFWHEESFTTDILRELRDARRCLVYCAREIDTLRECVPLATIAERMCTEFYATYADKALKLRERCIAMLPAAEERNRTLYAIGA